MKGPVSSCHPTPKCHGESLESLPATAFQDVALFLALPAVQASLFQLFLFLVWIPVLPANPLGSAASPGPRRGTASHSGGASQEDPSSRAAERGLRGCRRAAHRDSSVARRAAAALRIAIHPWHDELPPRCAPPFLRGTTTVTAFAVLQPLDFRKKSLSQPRYLCWL